MIRIMVVDDHPIVRQGLIAVLEDEEDFVIAVEAGSAEEALSLVAHANPDVILLDLELPGAGGVAAMPNLLAVSPTSRIIAFTAYDTEDLVLGALRAGARGYLLKGSSAAEITRAIREVAAGGSALTPRVASRLVAEVRTPRGVGRLTAREREVLGLIAQGLPSKQIGRTLNISERTVKFHTASLLRKLDAENRPQAIAHAAQRGLLDATSPAAEEPRT